ncbi:MAG: hypothetical protein JOZ15_13785 [Acidobacteria bacterium]|nr:hypothetical protein [Acidobacteriota bacterium]
MRTPPAWLLAAAMAAGLGGLAQPSAAAPRGEPGERRIELLSPRPAIPLVAGGTAVLQWAPLPGLAGLPAREEWEAFLSLDGGRSYPFRITPHLDSDLRRTLWEVPSVASADVRLLLRFGDERRETAIELPQRFTIAAAPGPLLAPLLAIEPRASLARHPGEAARPEDAGVVAWTAGSRRGTGRHQVVVAAAAVREGLRQPGPGRQAVALSVRPVESGPPAPARETAASPPCGAAVAPARARQAPLPPIDARLQTSRLNE